MKNMQESVLRHSKKELIQAIENSHIERVDLCKWFEESDVFAYQFANKFGEEEFVSSYISSPKWAYNWCRMIGIRDALKEVIIHQESSKWAYMYAHNFGVPEDMWHVISHPKFAAYLASDYPDFAPVMIEHIKTPDDALRWVALVEPCEKMRKIVEKNGTRSQIKRYNQILSMP